MGPFFWGSVDRFAIRKRSADIYHLSLSITASLMPPPAVNLFGNPFFDRSRLRHISDPQTCHPIVVCGVLAVKRGASPAPKKILLKKLPIKLIREDAGMLYMPIGDVRSTPRSGFGGNVKPVGPDHCDNFRN